jgi:cytochrome c-type biogenesis protein CcmH/NrfG
MVTRSLLGSLIVAAFALAHPLTAQAESEGKALAFLSPSLTGQIDQFETTRKLAQSCYQATQFTQALQFFHQICSSGSANANDFYWLGESYAHLDQYNNAARAFEEAAKLDGANDKLKVRIAECHLASRNKIMAQEACRSGLVSVKDQMARQKLSMIAKICSMSEPVMVRGKTITER